MTNWIGFFDDFAPRYARDAFAGAGLTWVGERETAAVRDAFAGRPPGRVLDAGAGTGRITSVLRSLGWEVIALDASTEMLARHARNEPAARRLRCRLGEPLPFPDATFDAVVTMRVLKYVADVDTALTEFARVVRPGGLVVVEIANRRSLARLGYRGASVRLHSIAEAEQMLRAAGFTPVARAAGSRLPHPVWSAASAPATARAAVAVERMIRWLLGDVAFARSLVIAGRRS